MLGQSIYLRPIPVYYLVFTYYYLLTCTYTSTYSHLHTQRAETPGGGGPKDSKCGHSGAGHRVKGKCSNDDDDVVEGKSRGQIGGRKCTKKLGRPKEMDRQNLLIQHDDPQQKIRWKD
jgi:hypothetical protein